MTSLPISHDSNPVEPPPVSAATLSAAARGDAGAWRVLVERYARRIFALAKSRCHSVHIAEEITQSVFVTVATKLRTGEYDEQGKFEAWLFRIVVNRVRDHVRRQRREGPAMQQLANLTPRETAPRLSAEWSWSHEELRAAVEHLPEADRQVIELRHHAQMSFKQMAEMLEEPMGTLLARHHRALRKLRTILSRSGVDEDGDLAIEGDDA